MKLCKDCSHFDVEDECMSSAYLSRYARCVHPEFVEPVVGRGRALCSEMRAEGEACGPDGKLFFARPVFVEYHEERPWWMFW